MRFPFALPKKELGKGPGLKYPFSEGKKTCTGGFPICVILLVGGFKPIEKNMSQNGNLPQFSG